MSTTQTTMKSTVFALIFLWKLAAISACQSQVNERSRRGICQKLPRSNLNPMFLESAEKGDLPTVACLLEFGADVNTKSWEGYTALIKASINGNMELIEFLIKNGADINSKTKHGLTALLYAAKLGHTSAIELLVTEGAEVNVKDKIGMTPLMYLARNGYINMVTNLISEDIEKKFRSIDISTFVKVSKDNTVETVKFLIDHRANVNAKTVQGHTALTYASRDGFLETVKHLIENGAEVNSATSFGYTALMLASSQFGHAKVIDTLIDNGIDTRKSKFDDLIEEIKQSHVKITNILIKNGANVNSSSKSGVTALRISATSLTLSSISGQEEIVRNLILHGADVKSTLDWAKDRDSFEQVKNILIKNGASIL